MFKVNYDLFNQIITCEFSHENENKTEDKDNHSCNIK